MPILTVAYQAVRLEYKSYQLFTHSDAAQEPLETAVCLS
jgi:hypothetical protein